MKNKFNLFVAPYTGRFQEQELIVKKKITENIRKSHQKTLSRIRIQGVKTPDPEH
jgi:hypothetical protein